MRSLFEKIRNTLIAGFIFLIPIFLLFSVIVKMWKWLTEYADKVARLAHLDADENKFVLAIVSLIINLLFIYLCGLFVNIRLLKRFRDWIENSILQYIPGYLTARSQILSRVEKQKDLRIPAMVETVNGFRPGLIIVESESAAVVFFPSAPDTNNGMIETVPVIKLNRIDMTAPKFLDAIQSPASGDLLRLSPTLANP
jgi:uncharacterized membrane protein